jgi:cytochrome c-type biogenesis protein CcmF
MIPELGHFALILALLVAIVQSAFGLAGPALQRERWIAAVRPAVTMQFLLQSAALLALMFAFVSNDFSVQYVAQNSNSALPVVYRVAAVWVRTRARCCSGVGSSPRGRSRSRCSLADCPRVLRRARRACWAS